MWWSTWSVKAISMRQSHNFRNFYDPGQASLDVPGLFPIVESLSHHPGLAFLEGHMQRLLVQTSLTELLSKDFNFKKLHFKIWQLTVLCMICEIRSSGYLECLWKLALSISIYIEFCLGIVIKLSSLLFGILKLPSKKSFSMPYFGTYF